MGKVHTRFQTKTAQKVYPLGSFGVAHTYMAYIREYPPPGIEIEGLYGVYRQPSNAQTITVYCRKKLFFTMFYRQPSKT